MRVPKGGIAFFDSGIGGLTVLAACRKRLPNEVFYYYGDNGNAPYGNLSEKKIQKLVLRAFRRFRRLRITAAVIACNTATALCIDTLREKYSFPILGAEPAVRLGAKTGDKVFVLSTKATYESERFRRLCRQVEEEFPNVKIEAYPCAFLAGEIERNIPNEGSYSALLPKGTPDVVVLGCTHYVYVARQISAFYGCKTVDGNEGISKKLQSVLCETKKEGKIFDHEQPPKTRKGGYKAKKRTFLRGAKVGKCPRKAFLEKQKKHRIFFLGGHKKQNFSIFEQMFG